MRACRWSGSFGSRPWRSRASRGRGGFTTRIHGRGRGDRPLPCWRRDFAAVGWDNLIEEIDYLAGRHEDAWTSYCANVLSHMLKIQHSEAREACKHWVQEILTWRNSVHKSLGIRQKFRPCSPMPGRRTH